jgi:alanyl aminopeptidase
MRSLVAVPLVLLACSAGTTRRADPTGDPGIAVGPGSAAPVATPALSPPLPTLRLPRNFVPTGYQLTLAIDPTLPTFTGEVAIAGTVTERSALIWLHGRDLAVSTAQATQGDRTVALTAEAIGDDLLAMHAAEPLAAGAWTLTLSYTGKLEERETRGGFRQQVGNDWYVFTQLESIFARHVVPSIDEPDVKVPWQLTLDIPAKLVAVSNTPETSTTALDAGHKRVAFAQTRPLPSYLLAFAVGPFEIVDAGKTRSGTPMRIITLAGRTAEAAWAVKTTPAIVATLEDWFGMPYPYEKLDQISIPKTLGFGAMENAGLITYVETLILVPKNGSWKQKRRWVSVAGHEVAHQWFGDLVTMKWWDDIWLNEGFATWMQAKVLTKVEPAWHDELEFLDDRATALGADSLVTARQVRQPIDTVDDIFNAFDRITYDKGASVLHMFEHHVGPELFQRGVRAYLAAHADGNATSNDFVGAISAAAGRDVGAAFATFLEQPGVPLVSAQVTCEPGKPASVALAQQRLIPPGAPAGTPAKPWALPLCIAYDQAGKRAEKCIELVAARATVALDGDACPTWVLPNPGGHAYARVNLTSEQLTALGDKGWRQLDVVERIAVADDLRAQVVNGEVEVAVAIGFLPRLLAETSRHAVGQAIALAEVLRPHVPADRRARFDAWVRATFGPRARKLGWLPRATDDLDAEVIREDLTALVAAAGDRTLRAQAVKLARTWRTLPPAARHGVLTAAVDADAKTFARILADVRTETDQRTRRELLEALAHVTDPDRQREVLALMIDTRLDIRDTMGLVFWWRDEPQRKVAEDFFKTTWDAIWARLPTENTTGSAAKFAALFTQACSAERRDEIVTFATEKFAALRGGARTVRQRIEEMDQCIARRKLIQPQLETWLAGLKLR